MSWYTVYNAWTDEILACGFWEECAKRMGMTPVSFHSMISRVNHGKVLSYIVTVENIKTGKMKTYGAKNGANKARKIVAGRLMCKEGT